MNQDCWSGKDPDQIVDGEFRDVFSPVTRSPANAVQGALEKVKEGQTQRVDIVLAPDRTDLTPQQIIDAFNETYADNLDYFTHKRPDDGTRFPVEEITVMHNGVRIVVYPT